MPKVIESPFDRWPGTITLKDPLSYPEVFGYLEAETEYFKAIKKDKKMPALEQNHLLLPLLFRLCESCDMKGVILEKDKFPANPIKEAAELVAWLWQEVTELVMGEQEVPNA